MRGMEDLLIDLSLHRGFVEKLLEGLTRYALRTLEICLERFEFECIAISDDYGTQQSTLISPEDWRTLVKPRLARIYGLAKQRGKRVFHHSCGHNTPIIGDMIDIGLDILHPIQPETMDIVALKREFGRRVTFCGGIPTQGLLVEGTPEQVRQEVRRLKRVMGEGGGYILEPGITIQADVPAENIYAMVEEARA
jgi:uroporphyrinogen decarboxylase